jgi:hypothetical protein
VLAHADDLGVGAGRAVQGLQDRSVGADTGDEAIALRGGLQPVREPRGDAARGRVRHHPVDQRQPRRRERDPVAAVPGSVVSGSVVSGGGHVVGQARQVGRERLGPAGRRPGERDTQDVVPGGLRDQQKRLVRGESHAVREDQPGRDEVELGAGRVVAEDAAVGPVLEQVPLVVLDAEPGRAVGEVNSAVGGHGGVVGELEPLAAVSVGQDLEVTGLVGFKQPAVGVADDEGAVARVDFQAQRAAVGVGEELSLAGVWVGRGPPPDPAVLDAGVQPTGGVDHHVLGPGPAGYLPPFDPVEHLVGGEDAGQGRPWRRDPGCGVGQRVGFLAGPVHDAPPGAGHGPCLPPGLRLPHRIAQPAERAGGQLDHVAG